MQFPTPDTNKMVNRISLNSEFDQNESCIEESSTVCRKLIWSPNVGFDRSIVTGSFKLSTQFESPDSTKRGRPKLIALANLNNESVEDAVEGQCTHCGRFFKKWKCLKAHLLTHTGEKPYKCDFPNCHKTFRQGGQLKTHQRLHTGEKPFCCSTDGCQYKFTHVNRHCPMHPDSPLIKEDTNSVMNSKIQKENDPDKREWMEKYFSRCSSSKKHNNDAKENEIIRPKASKSVKRLLYDTNIDKRLSPRKKEINEKLDVALALVALSQTI